MLLRPYYWYGEPDRVAMLAAHCPACDYEHNFRVSLTAFDNYRHTKDVWTFNGDYERPTFSPSMLANKGGIDPARPICHSFLENGQWRYLGDCTHELAGKTAPMVPVKDRPGTRATT